MIFDEELIKGNIVNVYKNIIVDVELDDGSVVPCFCYLDNILKGLALNDTIVYMTKRDNARRKIEYEAQIIEKEGALIAVDPVLNEIIFKEALDNGVINEFAEYVELNKITSEDSAKYASFELVKQNGEKIYVYMDTIYRKEGDYVVFPSNMDFLKISVLEEFRKYREEGYQTVLFNIVPRDDIKAAKFVWSIDQIASAKLFDEAKNGLKIYCYGCKVDKSSILIDKKLEIV